MASELETLNNLAKELYDKKQYSNVISLLIDEALKKHNDAELYLRRGDSWDEMGDYDRAIADYDKAIELKPDYANAYNNRGNSWHQKGQYDKAITDYSKAIELQPDYALTYYNCGVSYDNNGEYEKAIAYYDKAIKLQPDYADAYNNRGNSWHNKGEYDKAIADYNKAIALKLDYAQVYYNRGNSFYNKGQYDKAIADFNKTIKLKPDYGYGYYGRGLVWTIKSEPEKAVEAFRKYLELIPDKTDIWAERAKSNIKELLKLQGDKNLKEIDGILKGIKKLLSFNSGCVTHYTSLTVAKYLLLEDSSFRISEGAFLNDTSEGRELFKFLQLKITPDKGLDDTVAEPFAQKPFIGSFVEETKHDDLNLWRMYGKENNIEAKGCALTIKADKFVEGINKALESGGDKSKDEGKMTVESDDINFYRVAYRRSDKQDEFIVPELKSGAVKKLNSLLKDLRTSVKDYDQTAENKKDLEEAINSIAFLFKSDVYRSENELRLVVKGVGFEKKRDMSVTPPKVYIDLVNIKPMVEILTLGPKVEKPDEWGAAFYYSYASDEKPKILISHLPFK